MLCAYLSAALLAGLLGNAALGIWWLDPAAALVIAAVAVREGIEAWRGEGCCAPSAGLPAAGRGDGCAPTEAPAGDACADDCCAQPTASGHAKTP